MRILFTTLLASTMLAAAPANAAPVLLRFQGVIPSVNSFFGSGSGPFSTFQQAFFAQANWGNSYDFTVQYDTDSTATGGRYPLTLVSGRVGTMTDFSAFAPYLEFVQAGAYHYMNMMLRYQEPTGHLSYVGFALGDKDGTVVPNVLPETVVAADYHFINVSFEIYGNGNRRMVDSQSRGLTQVPPPGANGAVPEPTTWALMIAGFGLIGGALRRRTANVAFT